MMYVQYCTQACRVLSFVTVIFIIGFIMVKSDQLIGPDKLYDRESFAEATTTTTADATEQKLKQDVVTTIFMSYLGRQPTATELDAYTSKMSSPTDYTSVMVKLQATVEYKATVLGESPKTSSTTSTTQPAVVVKTAATTNKAPTGKLTPPGVAVQSAQDAKTALYRKIINTYLNVMDRYPTDQELSYYAKKMTTEPAFTIDKLVSILESSREYKIKEKTQTNIINSSLDGIITDAQLTYEVRRLFAQVYSVQLASYETEQFLKQKFVEFQLDVGKFVQLLKLMKQLDEAGLQGVTVVSEDSTTGGHPSTGSTTKTVLKKKIVLNNNDNVLKNAVAGIIKPNTAVNTNTPAACCDNNNVTINIISPSGVEVQDIISQIEKGQLTPNADAASSVYSKFIINDPLYKRTAACAAGQHRDLLYEYRTARNADELGASCSRTSYYENLDKSIVQQSSCDEHRKVQSEMQADASGTVLSGAPLADAANTRVGSIMPSFIYRELPSCSVEESEPRSGI